MAFLGDAANFVLNAIPDDVHEMFVVDVEPGDLVRASAALTGLGDTVQTVHWDVNYWSTRRELMNAGEMFDGPPSELLSNIDTAMHSYNPDPDPELQQIDEAQLRKEIEQAIAGLKRLGYLTGA